jgi:hypothetical protein
MRKTYPPQSTIAQVNRRVKSPRDQVPEFDPEANDTRSPQCRTWPATTQHINRKENAMIEEKNTVELNPQPLPPVERIRIHLSSDTTYDLKKMNKITAAVLARIGCAGCHSGRIIEFQTIHDYVINPKTLEPSEMFGGLRGY